MEILTKENGNKIKEMGMELAKNLTEKFILVIGSMISVKVKESENKLMAIFMMGIGLMI